MPWYDSLQESWDSQKNRNSQESAGKLGFTEKPEFAGKPEFNPWRE